MTTFLDRLLSDARWYAYSILLAVALVVNFYLLSPAHGSKLRVLGIILSYFMAGGMLLLLRSLLRWLRSKNPKDPGGQSGNLVLCTFAPPLGKNRSNRTQKAPLPQRSGALQNNQRNS